jgi:hypothetical protein
MSEGFRPPPVPEQPQLRPESARARQQATETVQQIMGEDIAPPDTSIGTAPPAMPTGRTPSPNADPSTTAAAKDQATQVAATAKQAGAQVADTVQEQAGKVTAEAGRQASDLLSQAQSELNEQAAATRQRACEGLHALADELSAMVRASDQDGPATDLARQAADRAHQAAGWLADRDPGSLLNEVRSFARRRPGAYLAIALGAGVLAGRLTRGLTASSDEDGADAGPTDRPTAATSSPGDFPATAQLSGGQSVGDGIGGTGPADAAVAGRGSAGPAGMQGGPNGGVAP